MERISKITIPTFDECTLHLRSEEKGADVYVGIAHKTGFRIKKKIVVIVYNDSMRVYIINNGVKVRQHNFQII